MRHRLHRTPLVPLALALALAASACGGADGPDRAAIGRAETSTSPSTPTSTVAAAPDTTVPPPPTGPATALISPSGIVVPVVSTAGDSSVVRTPCNATATLKRGTPVGAPAVVLDPGHGGAEAGAVSPAGLAESGINLAVARQAQAALEAQGFATLLTRTGDYELTLPTRSEIARDVNPRAFVSVHHNADPDGPHDGPGSETYYQIGSADSKRLAGLIYEEVVKALSAYNVAWVGDRDAGAKYRPSTTGPGDYYAMLRQPGKVVSVIAELAFVSNPAEAELVSRPDVQKVEGQALARGIVRYLTTADPGSGFTTPYPRVDPPAPPSTGPPRPCRDPQL
ncbi:MAG TPA: N-acetylmuramoyl-L-alanine amidase [Acidimicrobiales bacterium]|nr:N-acetylmuramoyl-L-alanine amidase [Acidimicrobiales bacterium]